MDYATGILSFFLHCLNSFTAQASRFNFICISTLFPLIINESSTLYKLVQYSNLLQYSILVPYGELSTPSVLWFRALEIENV